MIRLDANPSGEVSPSGHTTMEENHYIGIFIFNIVEKIIKVSKKKFQNQVCHF